MPLQKCWDGILWFWHYFQRVGCTFVVRLIYYDCFFNNWLCSCGFCHRYLFLVWFHRINLVSENFKILMADPKFCRPKIFFWPKFLSDSNFFRTQNFFRIQNFFQTQHFFPIQIFSNPNFFWPRFFSGPKIFSDPK